MSAGQPTVSTLEFTEEMKGWISFGEADYERAAADGERDRNALMFHLTISVDDVERFVDQPAHQASAHGWVLCERLGGRLPVQRGVFNLFVAEGDPRDTRMLYRLFFDDGDGRPLTLAGFKRVKDDPGLDVWRDTSTLYTRILRGWAEDDDAELVASGIIRILPADFARQLASFRFGGPGLGLPAAVSFGRLFLGRLWDVYGHHVRAAATGGSRGRGGHRPGTPGAPR